MSIMALLPFVRQLLQQGSARLSAPPHLHLNERDAVVEDLRAAFDDHMLDVAGPPLAFAPAVALRAVEWAARACWLLLHRGESPEEIDRALPVLVPGPDAADHASGDVVYRLLAGVHRRARAADPRDALAPRLEEHLRRWPLSGILADIDAPPLTPVELGGHPGLLLLYAERFAARPRSAWLVEGPAREYLDLTLDERKPS
jgi:hypothetical protein